MDTARYVAAVLLVAMLPPGVAWWLVVHPFVRFWRRLGPAWTLTIVGTASIAAAAGLFLVRARLVGPDLGTRWPLVFLAVSLLLLSVAIAIRRRRHLTNRILAGVPELTEGEGGGTLLTEGIYARIRHPRYVEVAVGTFGYAFFANYGGAYVVAAATVPLLHLVVLLEERELVDRFGDRYREYQRSVPRYLPRRRPAARAPGVSPDDGRAAGSA